MTDWQVQQIVDAIREHTREYETVTVRRDDLDALLGLALLAVPFPKNAEDMFLRVGRAVGR